MVLDGTVSGAALVVADRLEFRGAVDGDLRFAGRTIAFDTDLVHTAAAESVGTGRIAT